MRYHNCTATTRREPEQKRDLRSISSEGGGEKKEEKKPPSRVPLLSTMRRTLFIASLDVGHVIIPSCQTKTFTCGHISSVGKQHWPRAIIWQKNSPNRKKKQRGDQIFSRNVRKNQNKFIMFRLSGLVKRLIAIGHQGNPEKEKCAPIASTICDTELHQASTQVCRIISQCSEVYV